MTGAEAGNIGKLLTEVLAEMAHMREAHAADVARAVAEDRAAVVAWLRANREASTLPKACWEADAIERGEHRREKEEK
jgi:hypothetical protein